MSEIEELKARIAKLEQSTQAHGFSYPKEFLNSQAQSQPEYVQTLQPMPRCGICGRDYSDAIHAGGAQQFFAGYGDRQ